MWSKLELSASSEWNSTIGGPLPPMRALRRLPPTLTLASVNGADGVGTGACMRLLLME
jgi:hypothetical protein